LATVEEMAARYLKEIRTVQAEAPYFLAGFCLGSYIALEMARQLKAVGQEVGFLGVFDTSGEWKTVRSLHDGIAYHRKRMSTLSTQRRFRYVLNRVRYRWGRLKLIGVRTFVRTWAATGLSCSPHLVELSVFELNVRGNHYYNPGPYAGRVDYFLGKDSISGDPRVFWGQVALGGIRVHSVPGAGRHLFQEPQVGPLAEALKRALADARAALGASLASTSR
jgi:hypothetical protein